ncbi:carbohydrate ABC transporter permease [Deinococcus apachensis]|uniref:carbohydrate ABC transporter permease n=1 Tax=Deinococcus apachensis TaxID=309886 RepID=UPI001B7FB90A|nr:sugar ABC transporter permease [Deinococcus apachensis]
MTRSEPRHLDGAPTMASARVRQPRPRSSDGPAALLMVAPALLGLILFVVIPFVLAVSLSFTNQRLLSPNPTEFVGLQNYTRLLSVRPLVIPAPRDASGQVLRDEEGHIDFPRVRSVIRGNDRLDGYKDVLTLDVGTRRVAMIARDPVFWRALLNTLTFALLVVPLQCGLALLLAMLVNQKLPGVPFFRTVFFSPVVASMVVLSIVWSFLYDRQFGLINQLLTAASFGRVAPIDWLGNPSTAMLAIVIMSAWQGMGFQMVIFLAGLQGIPQELYEAADLDGANAWQRFRFVTLPGLRNTMVFVLTTTAIAALGLFTQVDVMTQGGPNGATTTIMLHAVRSGFREQDIAYGSAITVVFFLMILMLAFIQRRLVLGGNK